MAKSTDQTLESQPYLSTEGKDYALVSRPEDHYLPHATLEHIARLALLAKSRQERQAIALFLYLELPYSEASKRMDITAPHARELLESVRVRERRAAEFERTELAFNRPIEGAKKARTNGSR